MKNKLIKINKWSETFESADSRKRQRLGFYYMPSGCDSAGFLSLMSEFEAAEAWQTYGTFVALCQHAATMRKEVRGKFVNSNNQPMTIKQIAMLIRCDHDILERSLEILMDQRVGWISASDVPPSCHQSATSVPQNSGFVHKDKDKDKDKGEGQGQGQGQEKAAPRHDSPMDEFKTKINKLRPEWQSPSTWSYAEEQHLFNGAAKQMAELEDDDWQVLEKYFAAYLDQAKAYWRPNSRSKFVESFADVWAGCQRWRGKSGNIKTKTNNQLF